MIRNERQYRITRTQAEKFAQALEDIDRNQSGDTALIEVQRAALESQLQDLRDQLAAYDALRDGKQCSFELPLAELPEMLIRGRIAARMTQLDLAKQLDICVQNIQRYEVNRYAGVGFERVCQILRILGVHVKVQVSLPSSGEDLG